LAVALLGCATVPQSEEFTAAQEIQVGSATVILLYAPVDAEAMKSVARAISESVPLLEQRWGPFTSIVTARLHPSHDALERAVNRPNYPWLRAWSRYDTIDIQSPRTWGPWGADFRDVKELLVHELTHCLMYQRSATAWDWPVKGIPIWFREGMASVTAAQGYRRKSDPELAQYMAGHPDYDPIIDADKIYQREADAVYGAAHGAFSFLTLRYSDDAVRKIMDRMKTGENFRTAFVDVLGISSDAFAREYSRYLKLGGWAGRPRGN